MAPIASGEVLPASLGTDETIRTPNRRGLGLVACLALVLAGWAVYSNSFGGEFTFDDGPSIARNATIQQGWWEALHPPMGTTTVCGRPLVNFSLALNYRLGGLKVWGYHAANLAIQLLAGLTLFGLVRRTLVRPALRERYGASALPLALMIALLWIVHPLQTESVTYIVQRAESLMGLFYLLTLYCFVRGVESSRPWVWHVLSATACLLGMVTKETMVTVPVMVWLYDRTFVAGTFAEAWRQRWKLYATMACTWLPLAWLVASVSVPANASVIYSGLDGLNPVMKSYVYALKQCEAIVRYLALSFWPHPLVFNYGNDVVRNPLGVAPQIVVLALLLGGVIYALWRKPALGFVGAWFFVILAPTSSVVPLAGQTTVEHHMYLSLAALMALVVLGLHALLGRGSYVVLLFPALALGGLTFERNRDYRTDISISADTVTKNPDNLLINTNLGIALDAAGRNGDAVASYETALRISPNNPVVENNLGSDLNVVGQPIQAVEVLDRCIALGSPSPQAYYNLGNAYTLLNKASQAREAYLEALRINPNYAAVHNNLGNLYLSSLGQPDQAIKEYQAALQTDPSLVWAEGGLGYAYLQAQQPAQAIPHFLAAIRLNPNFGAAYRCLGDALLAVGRISEAIPQYENAERLLPGDAATRNNLAAALFKLGRYDESVRQFEETLRLDPQYPNARDNLETARRLAQQSPPPALNSPK